ncbi:unnamed protein product [Ixodes persulcatus]
MLRRTLILCPNVALTFRTRYQSFSTSCYFIQKLYKLYLKFLMGKWRPTELFDTWSSMLLKMGNNGAHFPIEFLKKTRNFLIRLRLVLRLWHLVWTTSTTFG